jgi:hypothetical protein
VEPALDVVAMVEIAQDEFERPDLHLRLLSSTGDTITVQVVDGIPPFEPDNVVYVQGGTVRGLAAGDVDGRVLLALGGVVANAVPRRRPPHLHLRRQHHDAHERAEGSPVHAALVRASPKPRA